MASGDINRGAEFYARLFNVSERRIQQLAKDGIIPKEGRGKYPLIGTIQGYVRFLQERAAGQVSETPDSDLRNERTRLTRAQAEGQELKNAEALGHLIPNEFAMFALSRMAAEVASILDTLPQTMKRKHPDLETRHIDTLMRELAKARNQAASLDERLPRLLDDYLETHDGADS